MKKKNITLLNHEKSSKSSGKDLKVHFKNTRETAASIKGMNLTRAKKFLENVCKQKEIVPFVRYRYGAGRKAQLKNKKASNGRWPVKSAKYLLNLLINAEANAKNKGLDLSILYIKNIQVHKAMKGYRRTFRAHGIINPFQSNPCHIHLCLIQKKNSIPRSN
jgi:large subunit ribosomal protein L17e